MNANNNEIICKEGQVFGENIIDLKTDLEYDISNGDDEILFLEAQWDDIIRQSPSPNNINLEGFLLSLLNLNFPVLFFEKNSYKQLSFPGFGKSFVRSLMI